MKKLFAVLTLFSLAAPLLVHAANKANTPSSPIYIFTNDDGTLHTSASVYAAGGTQGAPTLTYLQSINTTGTGIGGGERSQKRKFFPRHADKRAKEQFK